MHFSSIDIFCNVIDNFGDIGVVYRFAKEMKFFRPSCRVRVFCDNMDALAAICPGILPEFREQEYKGITYINSLMLDENSSASLGAADVLVEAFGCNIPDFILQKMLPLIGVWINLEYLSAENWVNGYHQMPSIYAGGAVKKYFFMPGFTSDTGGVIIDTEIEKSKPEFHTRRLEYLNGFLHNFQLKCINLETSLFGTIFTYQRGFDALLSDIQITGKTVFLFVFGNKSREGMMASLNRVAAIRVEDFHFIHGNGHILFMPFIPQHDYDRLLCLADFNFVRGEDSLVRAILAEKPFIWNAYLQENKYHNVKVKAFCDSFAKYFDDQEVFRIYKDLMIMYNDIDRESPVQATDERYDIFFRNMNKIEHATKEMSYFMTRNCNLVEKFTDFIEHI
jgi:uncharacterized repeat protein (TIGR03837 family)